MIPYREQRANLRAVKTHEQHANLVVLDVNDPALVNALLSAGHKAASVLAVIAQHGTPATHSHNVAPIGDQLPERWYVAVVPEDGPGGAA